MHSDILNENNKEWDAEKASLHEQIKKLKAENKSLLDLLKNTENILDVKLKEHKVFSYNIKKLIEYVYPITQSYLSTQQRSTFQEFLDKIKVVQPTAMKKVNRKIQCTLYHEEEKPAQDDKTTNIIQQEITRLKEIMKRVLEVLEGLCEENRNIIPSYLYSLLEAEF